jgi:hypothetical protein
MLAMLSLMVLPMRVFAQEATEVSGRAFGISATGPVTIAPTPVVTLPATGGDRTDTVASINQGGISTGVLSVSTSGTLDPGASTATATVNDLAVGVNLAGVATDVVSATTLEATSSSACDEKGTASSTGDSIIEGLTLLGNPVTVTGEPNQTVTAQLPGGAGSVELVINEQVGQQAGDTSELTVNALRVTITVAGTTQTVVVASATSDIVCAAPAGDDQQGGGDDQGGDDQQGGGLPKTGGAPVPMDQSLYAAGTAAATLVGLGIFAIRRRFQ